MIFWRIYADVYDCTYNAHLWRLVYDATKSPYAPVNMNAHDIVLNMEMSAAGSLSFTLEQDHPEYSLFDGGAILRTTVRVVKVRDPKSGDYGAADWIGRVIRVSKDYYGSVTVECEGGLSWLNDVHVRPIRYTHTDWGKDGTGWSHGTYTIVDDPQPLSTVMSDAMSVYNTYNQPKRRVHYSGVAATLFLAKISSSSQTGYPKSYGVTDYKKYLEFLNECLDLDECAGLFWQPTFIQGTNCLGVDISIIDLSTPYAVSADTTIDIDLNLVDHTEEYSADDIFSVVIPQGNNGIHMTDPYCTYEVDADGNYTARPAGPAANHDYCDTVMVSLGNIEVKKDFDCDTPWELAAFAQPYAAQYFVEPPCIVTLRAVDMALVQSDAAPIGINTIVGLKFKHINDWKSGKSYVVNDRVKYEDKYYKCTTANNDETFDDSKWEEYNPFQVYRCIKANINIDDPGESEYTLIPATSSGASYYKRQLSLSRALAQVSHRLPDSIKNQDEIDSGLGDINEIMKVGNRVTLMYGNRSEVIEAFQDAASAADPSQPKSFKFVASTTTSTPNSGGNT